MRYVVISVNGDFLPVAYRMAAEGADVVAYIHEPVYRSCYDGLLGKLDFQQLCDFPLDPGTTVIFDCVRPYRGSKEDDEVAELAGLKKPARGSGIFGAFSDVFRQRGCRVIGMSRWTEKLELDRSMGKRVAEEIGIPSAQHFEIASEKALALALADQPPTLRWVLKHNGNETLDTYVERYAGEIASLVRAGKISIPKAGAILEQYVEGVTLDEEVWWDGENFHCLNSTVEHKRFGASDTGPHVGSAINVCWAKEHGIVQWRALVPALKESGYVGPIDATMRVSTSGASFLEWCPRFGYDALFAAMRIFGRSGITTFFDRGFSVGSDPRVITTSRVSLPPYPAELDASALKGWPICSEENLLGGAFWLDVKKGKEGIECAGSDGILGVITEHAEDIQTSTYRLESALRNLKIPGPLQYRSDLEILRKDWTQLRSVKGSGLMARA